MRALLLLALLHSGAHAGGGGAGAFLSVEEALALAFPECRIERRAEFLSEPEEKRVEELARCDLASRVVRPYVAWRGNELVGTAYFDAHRVRTKNEVLMLVVGTDSRLQRVEVLAFAEPVEYLPRATFYAQFEKRGLDDDLDTKRAIRGVAGATLSAEAATAAARRVLALHKVLGQRTSGPPATTPR